MAINAETVRWASTTETDPLTGQPNKIAPTASQRLSGLKREEPLPRQYLNSHFNSQFDAFVELQNQIDQLNISASGGIINTIYPVGAYYITENTENPNTTLGVGSWTKVEGRFLVGTDSTDTLFDGVGEQGGSKTHSHTNTLAVAGHVLTPSQLPAHSHTFNLAYRGINTANEGFAYHPDGSGTIQTDTRTTNTSGGGNEAHSHSLTGGITTSSNLPPYRAVNIWRRIG